MSHVQLLLLRGPHTLEQIPLLANHLQRADIILLECLALQSQVKPLQTGLNAISSDAAYAAQVEHLINSSLKDDFIVQLAWHFRNSGKKFYLIDKKYRKPEKIGLTLALMRGIFNKIDARLGRRYQIVNKDIARIARIILARDKLTARQITRIVESVKKQSPAKKVQIAVVQGYLHRTLPELKQLLLNTPIKEKIFDPATTKELSLNVPLFQITLKKLANIDIPLSHKEIDYFLYQIIWLEHAYNKTDFTFSKTGKDKDPHFIPTNDPKIRWMLKAAHQVHPINYYTEAELAAFVEKLWNKNSAKK